MTVAQHQERAKCHWLVPLDVVRLADCTSPVFAAESVTRVPEWFWTHGDQAGRRAGGQGAGLGCGAGALGDSPSLAGSSPLLSVLTPQLALHQVAPECHGEGVPGGWWGVSAELSSLSVELQHFHLNTRATGRWSAQARLALEAGCRGRGPCPPGAAWALSPASVGRLSPGGSSVGAFVPGHRSFVAFGTAPRLTAVSVSAHSNVCVSNFRKG